MSSIHYCCIHSTTYKNQSPLHSHIYLPVIPPSVNPSIHPCSPMSFSQYCCIHPAVWKSFFFSPFGYLSMCQPSIHPTYFYNFPMSSIHYCCIHPTAWKSPSSFYSYIHLPVIPPSGNASSPFVIYPSLLHPSSCLNQCLSSLHSHIALPDIRPSFNPSIHSMFYFSYQSFIHPSVSLNHSNYNLPVYLTFHSFISLSIHPSIHFPVLNDNAFCSYLLVLTLIVQSALKGHWMEVNWPNNTKSKSCIQPSIHQCSNHLSIYPSNSLSPIG